LWFPAIINVGVNSKQSWRMKLALILSPPVSALI
jgi:hypothetical protein